MCALPALVPVGGKEDEDFPAMLVWSLQHAREAIHEGPFDAWVVHLTHTHRELLERSESRSFCLQPPDGNQP